MIFILLAALIAPRLFRNPSQLVIDAFYVIGAGFALLLVSKVSLLAKRIWISWGYSRMSKLFRVAYVLGYILIGIGIIILVAFKNG